MVANINPITLEIDSTVHRLNTRSTKREKPTRPSVRRIKEGKVPKGK